MIIAAIILRRIYSDYYASRRLLLSAYIVEGFTPSLISMSMISLSKSLSSSFQPLYASRQYANIAEHDHYSAYYEIYQTSNTLLPSLHNISASKSHWR